MWTDTSSPSAGAIRSSVSSVRRADEQSTTAGTTDCCRRCSAISFVARRPRGASGRSWSASSRSFQLDFACRSKNRRLMASKLITACPSRTGPRRLGATSTAISRLSAFADAGRPVCAEAEPRIPRTGDQGRRRQRGRWCPPLCLPLTGEVSYRRAVTIGAALFLIAVGAILKFAVTASVAGIDLQVVGVILMIVGVLGLLLGLILAFTRGRRPPPNGY